MRPGPPALLDRVADWLAEAGHGGGWPPLGLVLFGVFIVVVLPAQAAAGSFYTALHPAPDTERWYAPEDLYTAAEAWGEAGRSAYVRARVTFDVVWPLAYGIFLLTGLTWALGPGDLPGQSVASDRAAAGAGGAAGLRRERLHGHRGGPLPGPYARSGRARSVFTAAKWLTLTGCFVLLLVGRRGRVLVAVIRRRRRD